MDERKPVKFEENDIVAGPDWDQLFSIRPEFCEIYKIRAVEWYGCIAQYRIVQWHYEKKEWVKPWNDNDFFQATSRMEKYLEKINKLYALVKYGIG